MRKTDCQRLLRRGSWFIALAWMSVVQSADGDVSVAYRTDSPLLRFAVGKLDKALREIDEEVAYHDLTNCPKRPDVLILSDESEAELLPFAGKKTSMSRSVRPEGFQLLRLRTKRGRMLCIQAKDESGAMYGVLDLAEQVRIRGGLDNVQEKVSNPRFPFRAIKFNLPWSPYRSSAATEMHLDTCRDLNFWRRFLDMMTENRFNVLSLWNLHPFPFMIRPENFPEACPFSVEDMEEWRLFWRSLFRMAKNRGIETYIVNWNIVVSPQFASAYGMKERNDTSELVRRYTRECVTQVINEYEDLTGLGVTLADWMRGMTPKEREDWIEETFVAGMKRANRPVKFIHRSVLAGSPIEMRRVIDNANLPDPVWVEVKFNWSHGHSTPRLAITHDYPTGEIDERFWKPKPTNYKIAWMIRNEDFFILRWGEPDFIRQHIAINGRDYVGGYFVGSEGYIPAKDYSHVLHKHQTWDYAFEKQWLFYRLWGRLLYDPEAPNIVFEAAFERRYGKGVGKTMLRAYTLASRMPLRLASFHAATWDFTLYSEGFLAAARSRGISDGVSPFISIDELIHHETLDPTFISIPDYVKGVSANEKMAEGSVTPLQIAADSERDGRTVLSLIESLRTQARVHPGAFECELDDLETWANLSLYCADKLRAGVALQTFRHTGLLSEKEKAVSLLEQAEVHWENVVSATKSHYREVPYVGGGTFSWQKYGEQVKRDIEIARQVTQTEKP
ncbi:hypothetical protein HQ563_17080 [bacterium]|nr:hypothetical protein [bacterium]